VSAAPVVRRPDQVPARPLAPGVTVAEMLNDEHGCRGLHQRRLRFGDGAEVTGTARGWGEAWYVISGSGVLSAGAGGMGPGAAGTAGLGDAPEIAGVGEAGGTAGVGDAGSTAGPGSAAGTVELRPGTAVWLGSSLGYRCQGELEVLVITVQADVREGEPAGVREGAPAGERERGQALRVTTLESRPVGRTGDREFRVLLSEGLSITQFAGLIPPGRAPEHHHTYDEVVHVLAGEGVVHLGDAETEIGPGTSIYLPPYQPHCLENTGTEPLQVLGVFYPAGSPAAKQTS
jgi:mannose-6-phosphate isomerase-like protein (cupin superfamily)